MIAFLGARRLPASLRSEATATRHFDAVGFVLLATGLALLGRLPAGIRARLADAATMGFHDVIILVTIVSAVGLVMTLLLRPETTTTGRGPVVVESA